MHPTRYRIAIMAAAVVFCLAAAVCAPLGFPQSAAPQSAKTRPIPPPDARVDINHATAAELMKVPGITASWAGRIVRYRPYRTKQDLLDHGVLPADLYERTKDYVIAHREKQ